MHLRCVRALLVDISGAVPQYMARIKFPSRLQQRTLAEIGRIRN